jgi:MoaA/NifB/PqqE/SkfB family radical SAM enzyme
MESYTNRLRQSYKAGLPLAEPLNASIPLTSRCNSQCLYCPPDRTARDSEPSLIHLKELFQQLQSMGVRQVSLTGGEPTLRRDLEEIVRATQNCSLTPTLLTNGTLLTESRLASLVDAGLKGIVVSLDSFSPETYRAIRGVPLGPVLNGIEVLTRGRHNHPGIFACVTSVITKHNIRDLLSLANDLARRGLHYQIQPVLNQPHLAVDPNDLQAMADLRAAIRSVLDIYASRYSLAEKLYTESISDYLATGRLPHQFHCLGMFQLVHLDVDFNVYPCWLFPAVGSAKKRPLAELWNSEEMRSARLQLKKHGCPGCWLLCDAKPSLQYNFEEVS